MMARSGYWNHNVHYQPVILGAVPPGCQAALDVGCGDGLLAARLADRCAKVTGIDRDPNMIRTARAQHARASITFIEADFLAHPFPAESFDFVCANTSSRSPTCSRPSRPSRPACSTAPSTTGVSPERPSWTRT